MQNFQHTKSGGIHSLVGIRNTATGKLPRAVTFTFWADSERQLVMVKMTQVCFKSSLENLPVATIKKSKEWLEGEGKKEGGRQAAAGEKQIKPSKTSQWK